VSDERATVLSRVIRRRRMTRTFSGSVSLHEIVAICDTARFAPSAGFSQGTHFLILMDDDLREFWRVSGAGEWFATTNPGVLSASAVVLVLGDRRSYLERYSETDKVGHGLETAQGWSVPFWLTDAAMAAQNVLLLVEERRWGALFFGLFHDPRATLRHLGVPDEVECVGAIAIGPRSAEDQPSGSPQHRARKASAQQIHHRTW